MSEMFIRGMERSYGSGLGLYIIKQIIDKLKGKINIQSPGRGIKIDIQIPNLDHPNK